MSVEAGGWSLLYHELTWFTWKMLYPEVFLDNLHYSAGEVEVE